MVWKVIEQMKITDYKYYLREILQIPLSHWGRVFRETGWELPSEKKQVKENVKKMEEKKKEEEATI